MMVSDRVSLELLVEEPTITVMRTDVGGARYKVYVGTTSVWGGLSALNDELCACNKEHPGDPVDISVLKGAYSQLLSKNAVALLATPEGRHALGHEILRGASPTIYAGEDTLISTFGDLVHVPYAYRGRLPHPVTGDTTNLMVEGGKYYLWPTRPECPKVRVHAILCRSFALNVQQLLDMKADRYYLPCGWATGPSITHDELAAKLSEFRSMKMKETEDARSDSST